jgi:Phospholipase_D-nuclease N-terminal
MRRQKKWSELNLLQKIIIILMGFVQFTLLGMAILDLRKRTPEELNGTKPMWSVLVFINYFGPIAYFLFGRKRTWASREIILPVD